MEFTALRDNKTALAAPATGGTCVRTRRVEGKNAHAYSNK
jgi:hypothetical protein